MSRMVGIEPRNFSTRTECSNHFATREGQIRVNCCKMPLHCKINESNTRFQKAADLESCYSVDVDLHDLQCKLRHGDGVGVLHVVQQVRDGEVRCKAGISDKLVRAVEPGQSC